MKSVKMVYKLLWGLFIFCHFLTDVISNQDLNNNNNNNSNNNVTNPSNSNKAATVYNNVIFNNDKIVTINNNNNTNDVTEPGINNSNDTKFYFNNKVISGNIIFNDTVHCFRLAKSHNISFTDFAVDLPVWNTTENSLKEKCVVYKNFTDCLNPYWSNIVTMTDDDDLVLGALKTMKIFCSVSDNLREYEAYQSCFLDPFVVSQAEVCNKWKVSSLNLVNNRSVYNVNDFKCKVEDLYGNCMSNALNSSRKCAQNSTEWQKAWWMSISWYYHNSTGCFDHSHDSKEEPDGQPDEWSIVLGVVLAVTACLLVIGIIMFAVFLYSRRKSRTEDPDDPTSSTGRGLRGFGVRRDVPPPYALVVESTVEAESNTDGPATTTTAIRLVDQEDTGSAVRFYDGNTVSLPGNGLILPPPYPQELAAPGSGRKSSGKAEDWRNGSSRRSSSKTVATTTTVSVGGVSNVLDDEISLRVISSGYSSSSSPQVSSSSSLADGGVTAAASSNSTTTTADTDNNIAAITAVHVTTVSGRRNDGDVVGGAAPVDRASKIVHGGGVGETNLRCKNLSSPDDGQPLNIGDTRGQDGNDTRNSSINRKNINNNNNNKINNKIDNNDDHEDDEVNVSISNSLTSNLLPPSDKLHSNTPAAGTTISNDNNYTSSVSIDNDNTNSTTYSDDVNNPSIHTSNNTANNTSTQEPCTTATTATNVDTTTTTTTTAAATAATTAAASLSNSNNFESVSTAASNSSNNNTNVNNNNNFRHIQVNTPGDSNVANENSNRPPIPIDAFVIVKDNSNNNYNNNNNDNNLRKGKFVMKTSNKNLDMV